MALLMSELYRALRDAGTSDDQATKAATEVAKYDHRLNDVDRDLSVLKWMVGAVIALIFLVIGGIGTIWSQLGEIRRQIGDLKGQSAAFHAEIADLKSGMVTLNAQLSQIAKNTSKP